MATNFYMVESYKKKSGAVDAIRKAIFLIYTRWEHKAVFICSYGEKALGNEFDDFIADLGITHEESAPDTPTQNSYSERIGGILTIKARVIAVAARLSTYLFPWIYLAASYLTNRTPTKKLGWKTPFEKACDITHNLAHLQ